MQKYIQLSIILVFCNCYNTINNSNMINSQKLTIQNNNTCNNETTEPILEFKSVKKDQQFKTSLKTKYNEHDIIRCSEDDEYDISIKSRKNNNKAVLYTLINYLKNNLLHNEKKQNHICNHINTFYFRKFKNEISIASIFCILMVYIIHNTYYTEAYNTYYADVVLDDILKLPVYDKTDYSENLYFTPTDNFNTKYNSNFAILSSCIPGIRSFKYDKELISASLYNKNLYCNRHKITCFLENKFNESNLNNKWSKVQSILSHLQFFKYIVWLDCDALITNYNKHFDQLFDDDYDIITTKDKNGYNFGVIIIKNSNTSYDIFNKMYKQRFKLSEKSFIQDQKAFKNILEKNPKYKKVIKTINKTMMNSFPFYFKKRANWKKGHFIEHFCDCVTHLKIFQHCKLHFLEAALCQLAETYSNNGIKFKVCKNNYNHPYYIEKDTITNSYLSFFIKELRKYPESIFIDLGVGYGEFILAALSLGHKVYAFSVQNEQRNLFQTSLLINNFKNNLYINGKKSNYIYQDFFIDTVTKQPILNFSYGFKDKNIIINVGNNFKNFCADLLEDFNLFKGANVVYLQTKVKDFKERCLRSDFKISFDDHMEFFSTVDKHDIYREVNDTINIPKGSAFGYRQVKRIKNVIENISNPNFLVFGFGKESTLWHNFGNNKTIFLENNRELFYKTKNKYPYLDAYRIGYFTRLKNSLEYYLDKPHLWHELDLREQLLSKILEREWDVILIDSPRSDGEFNKNDGSIQGRSQSIFTASKLIKKGGHIFLNDCERFVSRIFANMILGEDNLVGIDTNENSAQLCHYISDERKDCNDLKTIRLIKNLLLK